MGCLVKRSNYCINNAFLYVFSLALDMMDVTKQKDLSGFYRNLLKQTCDGVEESSPKQDESKEKTRYVLYWLGFMSVNRTNNCFFLII